MQHAGQQGPAESLLTTIARTAELQDMLATLGDTTLDAVFDNELVQKVPILGMLCAMGKAAVSIRDRLFAKKVLKFLVALDSVPQEEREAQLQLLASDPRERQRVGEHLILLIDRLDDMDKSELLARAFQAFLKGKIAIEEFQSLAFVIDRILPFWIEAFGKLYEQGKLKKVLSPDEEHFHFLQCELLTMKFRDMEEASVYGGAKPGPVGYMEVNPLGKMFYDVVLGGECVQ